MAINLTGLDGKGTNPDGNWTNFTANWTDIDGTWTDQDGNWTKHTNKTKYALFFSLKVTIFGIMTSLSGNNITEHIKLKHFKSKIPPIKVP